MHCLFQEITSLLRSTENYVWISPNSQVNLLEIDFVTVLILHSQKFTAFIQIFFYSNF